MGTQGSILVIALVSIVTIGKLDPESGWPDGKGASTKVIGTSSRYDTTLYIAPSNFVGNEGALAKELGALLSKNAIDISIDGVAISSVNELYALGETINLERSKVVGVGPYAGNFFSVSGTNTQTYDAGDDRYLLTRTPAASDQVVNLHLPSGAMSDLGDSSGVRLKKVRLQYVIGTAILDDVTMALVTAALPASGTVLSSDTITFVDADYDAAHDTDAKRNAIGEHTLEITIPEADSEFFEGGFQMHLELTVASSSGTATFIITGWEFEFGNLDSKPTKDFATDTNVS